MAEFDYSEAISEARAKYESISKALDVDRLTAEAKDLEVKAAEPGLWDDPENAQKVTSKLSAVQSQLKRLASADQRIEDVETLVELGQEEEDADTLAEAKAEVESIQKDLDDMEIQTLLDGEYDERSAVVTIRSGAGGVDAADFAQMLLRMYLRWADSHGFSVEELDFLPGDEAGIKSVSLRISGENVYGFLKGERGIHRLIRISPFDSSGRRHTSFASVDVIPDAGDDIEIEIKESDLRVDIFCASGPGGQGVNTTYSAVRITHIPSGISVQCQNERSQHHNKDSAMRILRGRLYDLELSKRDAARQAEYAGKNAISFGSQIRTYTLQPYRLVKDHRNNCEIGDTDAVLDGRIDKLLRDYLLWQHANRQQQQQ